MACLGGQYVEPWVVGSFIDAEKGRSASDEAWPQRRLKDIPLFLCNVQIQPWRRTTQSPRNDGSRRRRAIQTFRTNGVSKDA